MSERFQKNPKGRSQGSIEIALYKKVSEDENSMGSRVLQKLPLILILWQQTFLHTKWTKKTQSPFNRGKTYLMILQWFVSNCCHFLLQRRAAHMSVEQKGVEGGENPIRLESVCVQIRLSCEGHRGCPPLKHCRTRNMKNCNKQLAISPHCFWSK